MTMRPTLEQELDEARRSVDQLQNELVLLDSRNRELHAENDDLKSALEAIGQSPHAALHCDLKAIADGALKRDRK